MEHSRGKAAILICLSILGGIVFAFTVHIIVAGAENKSVSSSNNAAALAGY